MPVAILDASESSSLAALAYIADPQVLEIEFRSGATHRYFDVPATDYEALLAAPSKGRHFNTHIRNRFRNQHIALNLKT
ncbi:MAG TPA: KTSC domain-containing protein [Acidobacteriaceae bacterium]|jgi:hypothetical protein|nr:KTSC domain-containing protein [Acidobacteriaceae bacterium]